MTMRDSKPLARPDALYWDDNGRIVCGEHAGSTLKYTLRTLSGHPAKRVSLAEASEMLSQYSMRAECEACGKGMPRTKGKRLYLNPVPAWAKVFK